MKNVRHEMAEPDASKSTAEDLFSLVWIDGSLHNVIGHLVRAKESFGEREKKTPFDSLT